MLPKHYTNEKTGISYTLHGDYYLPDLKLPEDEDKRTIGKWGNMHKSYLQQHKRVFYNTSSVTLLCTPTLPTLTNRHGVCLTP